MSKALVIKGANFAANKVTTVDLQEVVPCTGIALSQDTIVSTTLESEVELIATVTPLDTTEQVVWYTSNENVATVENGLVTIVGIGAAEITASCGSQSTACLVSSTAVIIPDDVYHAANGYGYSGSIDLAAGKNHIGLTTSATSRAYWSEINYTDGYQVFIGATVGAGKYVMPIPKGTEKISIDAPTGLRKELGYALANSKEKQTYVGGADGNAALGLRGGINWNVSAWPVVIDIRNYPTCDGFVFDVGGESGTVPSEITGKTTVTFGYYDE